MTRVVLHAGRHKSGTSSIQRMLSDNQESLLACGVLYPTTGRSGKIAHHRLAECFIGTHSDHITQLKEGLSSEIAEHRPDVVVVSSEAFQNVADSGAVTAFFQPYDLHVVAYFREALDYAQSSYAQRVQRSSITGGFWEYMRYFRPSYATMAARWERTADECRWRQFHQNFLKDGDVRSDFLSMLGVPPSRITMPAAWSNPSIGGNLLFAKLMLNLVAPEQASSASVYRAFEELAKSHTEFRNGFFISDANANEFRRWLASDNRFLESWTGELPQLSFADRPGAPEMSRLKDDLEVIFHHEDLRAMRSRLSEVVGCLV